MSESLQALRRANPRAKRGFEESVDAAAQVVRAEIAHDALQPRAVRPVPERRMVRVFAAGAAFAAAAVVVGVLTLGSSGGGVQDAAAAVRKAASLSAASAEHSGIAVVRITRGGDLWAGTTIRWHGGDLAVSSDAPRRPGEARGQMLLVGGMLYGIDPGDGGWVVLGSPESIDPGSGTTPAEYLAAVREDVGGATLRRISDGMNGLSTRRLANGSTAYSGKVPAGLIARKTGFKEGQALRLLPFGYVAHGEAARIDALLDAAVTVGADGIVREIAVGWGTGASAWSYTVTYSDLGATPAPAAPEHAGPLRDRAR